MSPPGREGGGLERSTIVLLTACINPTAGASLVQRADPGQRLLDYRAALEWWASEGAPRPAGLVFVDNSAADLRSLSDLMRQAPFPTEFFSFPGEQIPEGVHYGYGEMEIIEYALSRSALLKEAAYFMKCTGRLTFPKAAELLRKLPPNTVVAVDARAHHTKRGRRLPHVTTQIMLFEPNFYRDLTVGWRNWFRPDGEHHLMENYFWARLMRLKGGRGVVLRFPMNVDPRGVGAARGRRYNGPRVRVISFIRAILRRVTPGMWV